MNFALLGDKEQKQVQRKIGDSTGLSSELTFSSSITSKNCSWIFLCVYRCVAWCVCLCTMCMQYLQRPEEGATYPGTVVKTVACHVGSRNWPHSIEEEQPEPSPFFFFFNLDVVFMFLLNFINYWFYSCFLDVFKFQLNWGAQLWLKNFFGLVLTGKYT